MKGGKWSRSVMFHSALSWTVAYEAPRSMGFSRQEDWSGVPFPKGWKPSKAQKGQKMARMRGTAHVLSTFTTQIHPIRDKSGGSQRSVGIRMGGAVRMHSVGCGLGLSKCLHVALTLLAPDGLWEPLGKRRVGSLCYESVSFFKRNQKSGFICEILWFLNSWQQI